MTGASGETLAGRAASAFTDYRAGNERRMADLVDLLTPILWHTARAQRLDQSTAEDVVQTAWLRLVHNAASITEPQAVLAWLVVTTRREAWRVQREARRAITMDFAESDVLESPEHQPDRLIELSDSARLLWQHVAQLPERCQALLRVIAFADRPDYAAVAAALGMPVGSIGPTRGRCLAKLRQRLTASTKPDPKESR